MPALTPLRKFAGPLMAAVLLAAWDQATKAWTIRNLDLHEVRTVAAGWFDLVYVRNQGVAFSLLADFDPAWVRPALIASGLLAIAAMLWFIRVLPEKGAARWGLGLVIGGAAGNLVDRARLGFVVDFIDLYHGGFHWPAFNVADMGISLGVALLVADMIFGKKESDASGTASDR